MTKPGMMTLRSGRDVQLQELTQCRTYEGLLEGLPTSEGNAKYLNYIVAQQRTERAPVPVYFAVPAEQPIPLASSEKYALGTPAALPAVTCVGRFQSRSLGQPDALYYSELVIIWLQSDFAMPIAPAVLDEIAGIDWEAQAANFEQ